MSDPRVISIVRLGDRWAVLDGGKPLKRFDYRVDAEEKALGLARALAATGEPLQILVEGESGAVEPMRAPIRA